MARIALVHDIAGVARVQAELLRGAGHEVDQVALPTLGASWRWPAKAAALPLRVAGYLPVARRLRNGGYDVVHIHYLSQGLVGVLAGVRFFAQAHGSDLHLNLGNRAYRRLTRAVIERATKVFYVTPNLRRYLEGYEDKLVYLPNPVDVGPSGRQAPPPATVKRVLIFTRLHPVKGVERIFPAVEQLSARGFEVTALDYGPLAADYAARYGRWARFVKPVAHEKVGEFLAGFDLVIGQMEQGTLGLSEIEAMETGRPVITGIDRTLYPDDPPPVEPASGAPAIVEAAERLRANPSTLSRIASEGRAWAERNHGYQHHLRLLERAYFGTEDA